MGCDIHSCAERRDENGRWIEVPNIRPFDWRSYSVFGFLADVRNYSAVPPIAEPRGIPEDSPLASQDLGDWHSFSWLSVKELLAFNYGAEMEDRRVMINGNGGCTAPPGGGRRMTFREFLGEGFFDDLAELNDSGAERIVFGFDS